MIQLVLLANQQWLILCHELLLSERWVRPSHAKAVKRSGAVACKNPIFVLLVLHGIPGVFERVGFVFVLAPLLQNALSLVLQNCCTRVNQFSLFFNCRCCVEIFSCTGIVYLYALDDSSDLTAKLDIVAFNGALRFIGCFHSVPAVIELLFKTVLHIC